MSVTSVPTGVILVRNKELGPTIFSYDGPNGKGHIEWGRAGDPDQTDVQEVPEFVLRDTNFRRGVQRGVYEIVDATMETSGQISRAGEIWRNQKDAARQSSVASIDIESNNDIIGTQCVGPGPRGQCEEQVMVRELQKNDKPPLCSRHSRLASEYVPEESDERIGANTGGKPVVNWIRMGMSAPNEI